MRRGYEPERRATFPLQPTRLEVLASRLDVDSIEFRRWLQAEVERRRREATASEGRPRRP